MTPLLSLLSLPRQATKHSKITNSPCAQLPKRNSRPPQQESPHSPSAFGLGSVLHYLARNPPLAIATPGDSPRAHSSLRILHRCFFRLPGRADHYGAPDKIPVPVL